MVILRFSTFLSENEDAGMIGALPGNLSVEDLKQKHPSMPKNPFLADTFFKGGLNEAWGRGTVKIMEECRSHGLPEPEIEVIAGGVSVTILKDVYTEGLLKEFNLDERQIDVLLYWKKAGEIQNNKYKNRFNITDRTALRDLTELVEKGLLTKVGERKTGKYIYRNRNVG